MRHRPRVPRPWKTIRCDICQGPIVSQNERETHKFCMGKPQQCSCGQPSIPHPKCRLCKGSGRAEGDLRKGEICELCPPDAPCVACCMKSMLARIRKEREAELESR